MASRKAQYEACTAKLRGMPGFRRLCHTCMGTPASQSRDQRAGWLAGWLRIRAAQHTITRNPKDSKKYSSQNLNPDLLIFIKSLQRLFRLPRPTKLARPKALIILVIFRAFCFLAYASVAKVSTSGTRRIFAGRRPGRSSNRGVSLRLAPRYLPSRRIKYQLRGVGP